MPHKTTRSPKDGLVPHNVDRCPKSQQLQALRGSLDLLQQRAHPHVPMGLALSWHQDLLPMSHSTKHPLLQQHRSHRPKPC